MSKEKQDAISRIAVFQSVTAENAHQVLGLSVEQAKDKKQVKDKYKKLALLVHPDKNNNNADATRAFQLLDDAFKILIDTKKQATDILGADLFGNAWVKGGLVAEIRAIIRRLVVASPDATSLEIRTAFGKHFAGNENLEEIVDNFFPDGNLSSHNLGEGYNQGELEKYKTQFTELFKTSKVGTAQKQKCDKILSAALLKGFENLNQSLDTIQVEKKDPAAPAGLNDLLSQYNIEIPEDIAGILNKLVKENQSIFTSLIAKLQKIHVVVTEKGTGSEAINNKLAELLEPILGSKEGSRSLYGAYKKALADNNNHQSLNYAINGRVYIDGFEEIGILKANQQESQRIIHTLLSSLDIQQEDSKEKAPPSPEDILKNKILLEIAISGFFFPLAELDEKGSSLLLYYAWGGELNQGQAEILEKVYKANFGGKEYNTYDSFRVALVEKYKSDEFGERRVSSIFNTIIREFLVQKINKDQAGFQDLYEKQFAHLGLAGQVENYTQAKKYMQYLAMNHELHPAVEAMQESPREEKKEEDMSKQREEERLNAKAITQLLKQDQEPQRVGDGDQELTEEGQIAFLMATTMDDQYDDGMTTISTAGGEDQACMLHAIFGEIKDGNLDAGNNIAARFKILLDQWVEHACVPHYSNEEAVDNAENPNYLLPLYRMMIAVTGEEKDDEKGTKKKAALAADKEGTLLGYIKTQKFDLEDLKAQLKTHISEELSGDRGINIAMFQLLNFIITQGVGQEVLYREKNKVGNNPVPENRLAISNLGAHWVRVDNGAQGLNPQTVFDTFRAKMSAGAALGDVDVPDQKHDGNGGEEGEVDQETPREAPSTQDDKKEEKGSKECTIEFYMDPHQKPYWVFDGDQELMDELNKYITSTGETFEASKHVAGKLRIILNKRSEEEAKNQAGGQGAGVKGFTIAEGYEELKKALKVKGYATDGLVLSEDVIPEQKQENVDLAEVFRQSEQSGVEEEKKRLLEEQATQAAIQESLRDQGAKQEGLDLAQTLELIRQQEEQEEERKKEDAIAAVAALEDKPQSQQPDHKSIGDTPQPVSPLSPSPPPHRPNSSSRDGLNVDGKGEAQATNLSKDAVAELKTQIDSLDKTKRFNKIEVSQAEKGTVTLTFSEVSHASSFFLNNIRHTNDMQPANYTQVLPSRDSKTITLTTDAEVQALSVVLKAKVLRDAVVSNGQESPPVSPRTPIDVTSKDNSSEPVSPPQSATRAAAPKAGGGLPSKNNSSQPLSPVSSTSPSSPATSTNSQSGGGVDVGDKGEAQATKLSVDALAELKTQIDSLDKTQGFNKIEVSQAENDTVTLTFEGVASAKWFFDKYMGRPLFSSAAHDSNAITYTQNLFDIKDDNKTITLTTDAEVQALSVVLKAKVWRDAVVSNDEERPPVSPSTPIDVTSKDNSSEPVSPPQSATTAQQTEAAASNTSLPTVPEILSPPPPSSSDTSTNSPSVDGTGASVEVQDLGTNTHALNVGMPDNNGDVSPNAKNESSSPSHSLRSPTVEPIGGAPADADQQRKASKTTGKGFLALGTVLGGGAIALMVISSILIGVLLLTASLALLTYGTYKYREGDDLVKDTPDVETTPEVSQEQSQAKTKTKTQRENERRQDRGGNLQPS